VVAVHTRALCRNGRCGSDLEDASSIVVDSVNGDVSSAGHGSASAVRIVSYASMTRVDCARYKEEMDFSKRRLNIPAEIKGHSSSSPTT
jgi:hypothetical protein